MSVEQITGPPQGGSAVLPRQRGAGPATALLAIADPLMRRVMTDELSYREPWTFLEAETLVATEATANGHGPGELAVLDAAFGDAEGATELVRVVRLLRRGGWDHVVTVGSNARFDRIGATLSAGARGHLVLTDGTSSPDGPPGPAPRVEDAATSRVRVLDSAGQERMLSHREVEVLRLTAEGLGNTEIGDILGLSALTIKSHLARVTHRLRAHDRAHLVLLALRAGAIR